MCTVVRELTNVYRSERVDEYVSGSESGAEYVSGRERIDEYVSGREREN